MTARANRTKSGQAAATGPAAEIVIKKYANRRLYNTATSSYVTLDTLCSMVKDGEEFVVYDAKTGEDITRSVLTQIIVEEEAKGQNLLPISFLRQLIAFYGDSLQMVVPRYLEQTMATFAENQDVTRTRMQEAVGGMFPINQFRDMTNQNMALFESAMKMFAPINADEAAPPTEAPVPSSDTVPGSSRDEALQEIRDQLNSLQVQLQALNEASSDDKG